ncbi:hypothetical protein [Acinetobacter baumannii]|uniref:hypothetical protein n=1 Tax=Acinetobacter baumannii TaxID=470 RepID=UPI003CC77185
MNKTKGCLIANFATVPQLLDCTFGYHQLVTSTSTWLSAKNLFVQRQIANGYELSQKIRFFVVKINMDIKDAFPFCTNAPEYKG